MSSTADYIKHWEQREVELKADRKSLAEQLDLRDRQLIQISQTLMELRWKADLEAQRRST